jgi:tetratricopeptide (TPR) repeat protein
LSGGLRPLRPRSATGKDLDEAIEDLGTAIRLAPTHATAFYNRAIVHTQKGDYENAVKDLDRTLMLKPDFPNASNVRCMSQRALGRQC